MLETHSDNLSISCVITAHNEGLLLHTTLLSYEAMRVYAEERGLSVEWVIVLDSADAETVRVAKNHPSLRPSDTLLYVDNRSLSKSRNDGIATAKGDIIAILDGDDYYTRNFLFAAAKEAAENPNCVVHPHHIVSFGVLTSIQTLLDQREHPEVDAAAMVFQHPYISTAVARKSVFEELPYILIKDGFGFEDWHFNCEAMANGYKHTVAYDSFMFYRRKANGMLASMRHSIMPPSKLFTQEYINKIPRREKETPSSPFYTRIVEHMHKRWKNWSTRTFARWKRSLVKRNFLKSPLQPISYDNLFSKELSSFRAACLELTPIEPKLHPAYFPAHGPARYTPDLHREWGEKFLCWSNAYANKGYEIVYVVPWLVAGGADLMILNQVNTLSRMGKKVLVIATESQREHVWASRLDKDVPFLPLGEDLRELPFDVQQDFLCKLLLQIKPSHIHNINSYLCHTIFAKYNKQLKSTCRLYASLYCDELRSDNSRFGYIVDFLREEYRSVDKLVCDNTIIPKSWVSYYGIMLDNFHALYGLIPQMPLLRGDCTAKKILWTGRLCKQKRPDLLVEVAQSLPDMEFHIYGGKYEAGQEKIINTLETLPNVVMHGPYAGFASLPISEFFCLLYTSEADGLPNVLLETASTGLPIVGSVVGGIGDFLTEETGYPVPSNEVADFVDALRHVYANPEQAHARADNARELVRTRHREEAFYNSLRQLYSFED